MLIHILFIKDGVFFYYFFLLLVSKVFEQISKWWRVLNVGLINHTIVCSESGKAFYGLKTSSVFMSFQIAHNSRWKTISKCLKLGLFAKTSASTRNSLRSFHVTIIILSLYVKHISFQRCRLLSFMPRIPTFIKLREILSCNCIQNMMAGRASAPTPSWPYCVGHHTTTAFTDQLPRRAKSGFNWALLESESENPLMMWTEAGRHRFPCTWPLLKQSWTVWCDGWPWPSNGIN